MRNTLVVGEVAMALILLVGAGLLLRSFYRVIQADPGFRPEGILTLGIPLPQARFDNHDKRAAFVERLLENVRALPGVKAASTTLPLLGGWQSGFRVEGRPEPPPGQGPSADIARVTSDYFKTMSVRVLQGRAFDERDRTGTPPVCMVDEMFVRAHFPGEDPLGKRVKFGPLSDTANPWMEIVGVTAHVKNYGVDESSRAELYLPYLQNSVGSLTLVVRTDNDPTSLSGSLRSAVRGIDPELPVFALRTLDSLVEERTAQRRLAVLLISVFAAVALLLAAVGIYGVMSYSVAQRTQEIGIRMALGAEQNQILKMVLRHGTLMSLIGTAIGLISAFALARLITTMLFQTSAADPPTFSVVPLLLLAVALFACYVPARRAMRVDPMVALRNE
jgi:putative ABC transport system permease protein